MRGTICVFLLAGLAAAQDVSPVEMLKKLRIDRFYAHLDTLDIDVATKAKILKLREGATLGGEYGVIHQALLEIHPDYRKADALLFNERFAAAADQFRALKDHSKDPYVKAYATFRYGLAEMSREHFEEAEAAFRTVLNEFKKEAGCDIDAAFYRVVCLGQERKRDEALAAASTFLKDFPDAPERFQKAMEQIKNELMQEWESPLYDLAGRMNHVARKIEGGETGDETQSKQKEIVGIIEELIKKAEQNEGQGQGGDNGGGPPRGNQQPSGPANQSRAPPGQAEVRDLRPKPNRKPGDQWGEMRDKEREEVLQALKEKFPDRYRELLEQYHKALAEGKRVTVPDEDR